MPDDFAIYMETRGSKKAVTDEANNKAYVGNNGTIKFNSQNVNSQNNNSQISKINMFSVPANLSRNCERERSP